MSPVAGKPGVHVSSPQSNYGLCFQVVILDVCVACRSLVLHCMFYQILLFCEYSSDGYCLLAIRWLAIVGYAESPTKDRRARFDITVALLSVCFVFWVSRSVVSWFHCLAKSLDPAERAIVHVGHTWSPSVELVRGVHVSSPHSHLPCLLIAFMCGSFFVQLHVSDPGSCTNDEQISCQVSSKRTFRHAFSIICCVMLIVCGSFSVYSRSPIPDQTETAAFLARHLSRSSSISLCTFGHHTVVRRDACVGLPSTKWLCSCIRSRSIEFLLSPLGYPFFYKCGSFIPWMQQ